jgi:DNA-binding CsgD family transcriptional regulator
MAYFNARTTLLVIGLNIAAKVASRFSKDLACVHAARSIVELRVAVSEAVNALYPTTSKHVRGAWVEALMASSATPHSSIMHPDEVRGYFLLELLWTHIAHCITKLRSDLELMNREPQQSAAFASLTVREREVLVRIALGEKDAAVGRALGIATRTVGKHVEHILSKLAVETRAAAVAAVYNTRS